MPVCSCMQVPAPRSDKDPDTRMVAATSAAFWHNGSNNGATGRGGVFGGSSTAEAPVGTAEAPVGTAEAPRGLAEAPRDPNVG